MENKTATTSLEVQKTSPLIRRDASSDREIAARAYEIFLSRGATHGSDLDDWLQAEAECATGIASTTKARTANA